MHGGEGPCLTRGAFTGLTRRNISLWLAVLIPPKGDTT